MNVSQLRCAVTNPDWRARWKAGDNPPVRDFPKRGTPTAHGTKFHALARKLTAEIRTDPQADQESADALLARLYALGAQSLLEELLAAQQVDSAAILTTAFHALCRRLVELRQEGARRRSFAEIFLAEEYPIRDVVVQTAPGRLFVSGVIDCLRFSPEGHLVVVDYKLSTGEQLDKELVQIALYRHLLRAADPTLRVAGVLEYFYPELHVTPVTELELEKLVQDVVAPVLAEIVGAQRPQASSQRPPNFVPARPKPLDPEAPSSIAVPGALRLGATYGLSKQPVDLEASTLLRHSAVLGGSGSGKTTLALHIIEQMLARGIPALLVDRKGDLARYADEAAWQSAVDLERDQARRDLRERLDVALFTPGHSGGRPLSFALVPPMDGVAAEDQQALFRSGAQILGQMLGLKKSASDEAKRALMLCAIQLLAQAQGSATVRSLISLFESEDPSFLESVGVLAKEADKLLVMLKTFEVMNQELLSEAGEPLDAEYLLGLGAHRPPGGKVRLSIVSTRFFDSEDAALSWIAQLTIELNRYAARHPSPSLQALVMFDEADLYLPAQRQPVTKGPMENLLKRARSAGLGVMLATQSPGDLDYRCRDNVLTWLIGRVKEPTALEKLKPLAGAAGIDPESAFPKQKVGQFHLLTEGTAKAFQAQRSLLDTEQLPEREILNLAKRTRDGAPL